MGPVWASSPKDVPTHVCFHIDNTTAVAWVNKRSSSHPQAQLYNRLLSLAEFQHNLVCTANHIAGKMNTMADAGSRVWSNTHPLLTTWTNLSASWQQEPRQPPFNNLSDAWEQCCADAPWRALPKPSTLSTGSSGVCSFVGWDGYDGLINHTSRPLEYFATHCWANGWNKNH